MNTGASRGRRSGHDRPCNLYHWVAPDGRPLGLYANVGDVVRLDDAEIEWRDLVVDVIGTLDGGVRVLDEDELPPVLDPDLRLRIRAARDRVVREMPELLAESAARSTALLALLRAPVDTDRP